MDNYILVNKNNIKNRNYIRKADKKSNYWFSFYKNKINEFINNYKDDFNFILYGSDDIASDFYVIPYKKLKHYLVDDYIYEKEQRWVGSIYHNKLNIRNCPEEIDVSDFYSNTYLLNGNDSIIESDEFNDFSIENKLLEIKVRQKQSKFRNKVLLNFQNKCCLSNINELDLLVASHIIPWSHNISSRLDPSNGLCLSSLYDKLFDNGYISFNNDLSVIILNYDKYNISKELKDILNSINGKKANKPIKYDINTEYLEYHRNIIFKK